MTCNNCNTSCNSCEKKCKPAEYSCGLFDIQLDPYDPGVWDVISNGMIHKVRVPKVNETDTFLSANSSSRQLIYRAERHTDTIDADKLGSILNLGDLNDVDFDPMKSSNCYELIYHKWGDCGDGCKSQADRWQDFSIASEDALKDQIHYVRGANANGCPVYLEKPEKNEYYFAGWRKDTGEFGYYQAEHKDQIGTGGEVVWVDKNNNVYKSPLNNASEVIYNTYHRGNNFSDGNYYYSSNDDYYLHLAPDSRHGHIVGATGASSDPSCSNVNQDVIAIVHWCSDLSLATGRVVMRMTPYSSNESWSQAMENQRAAHFESIGDAAMPTSTSLRIPKGSHLVIKVAGEGNSGEFRIHQFRITWIPANIATTVKGLIQ